MTFSTEFDTASSLPIHINVPGYRLRAQVGEDALGLWFDAEQESLGRNVTIKVLKPKYAGHAGAHKEFLAEMDRLMALDHANLIRVLDTDRGEAPVLVTERAAARTLAQRLAKGALGEDEAFAAVRDVARAVDYLAQQGFAHKNITPRFISVRDSGGCRLLTFRYVITHEEQAKLKGKLAQDVHYIAPEQLGGDAAVGPTTPTYQLAALLFHLLAGKPPHPEGDATTIARKHFHEPFPSLNTARPFLRPAIYQFVSACTAKDPDERPDLPTFIDALQQLEAGKDPGISPKGDGSIALRARKRRRRRRR